MNRRLSIIITCAIVLIVLFLATNPTNAPSFILILPFVLLTVIIFLGIYALLKAKGFSDSKNKKIAVISTALPVMVLVLQSIGQLTIKDVVTITIVFILSYFYISRMTSAEIK